MIIQKGQREETTEQGSCKGEADWLGMLVGLRMLEVWKQEGGEVPGTTVRPDRRAIADCGGETGRGHKEGISIQKEWNGQTNLERS